MNTLLDRFCRYVRIDTQANESATTYPSSTGQLELGRMLVEELQAVGLRDASQDAHGIVLATIPTTVKHLAPTLAWIAHVDTSPETTGHNVKPMVHDNYSGADMVLPGDTTKVLRVADHPDLGRLQGKTIITTDGTTLLGGDDKAGVAVIMETAAYLLAHPEVLHGPIRVCFTCDEEIGHGVDHVDLKKLGAHAAYTLDGHGQGEIDGAHEVHQECGGALEDAHKMRRAAAVVGGDLIRQRADSARNLVGVEEDFEIFFFGQFQARSVDGFSDVC